MTFSYSSTEFDKTHEALEADSEAALQAPHFSGLEWSVIALAERDRIASLKEPGRMASALARLFGTERSSRLADDRLEALRRIAVLAWHYGWALPFSELRAFFAAGFSNDHYEMLQLSIARGRNSRRPRP